LGWKENPTAGGASIEACDEARTRGGVNPQSVERVQVRKKSIGLFPVTVNPRSQALSSCSTSRDVVKYGQLLPPPTVLSLGILFCSTHARGLLASNYLNLIAVGWGYNTLDVIFSAIICHMVQPKFQIANEANSHVSHVLNGHPTLGFPRYGIGLGIPEPPRAGGSRAWNSASRKINSSRGRGDPLPRRQTCRRVKSLWDRINYFALGKKNSSSSSWAWRRRCIY
jgi:hypothetical protein